jgi:hypothetical protein
MSRFDRRSLLRGGVAAGLAAVSGALPVSAGEQSGTRPAAPKRGAGAFRLEFTGLFICNYWKSHWMRAVLPDALDHAANLVVDLRFLDKDNQTPFDSAIATTGGQQLGIWRIEGTGLINVSGVTGAAIAPTSPADTTKCPTTAAVWESVSWLADLARIQRQPVSVDSNKVASSVEFTNGTFGAVMPVNPRVRDQKFVVVDDNDQDVTDNGNELIDQALANAFFYQGTIQNPTVVMTLPNQKPVTLNGNGDSITAVLSHLPKAVSAGHSMRRLDHFKHYYNLLKGSTKSQYPGVGNVCGLAAKPRPAIGPDIRNIEPIFCPPAYVQEP